MIQTGYRIAMLVSGAGALIIAARYGWFAAYATMAALLTVGMLVFISDPSQRYHPTRSRIPRRADSTRSANGSRLR
jgi:PAT family beta-lactamase induction signal transducer AmpG